MNIKYLLGCGAAVAAVAIALPAAAQDRTFDIPSQDLSSAISHFGRQSGLQIVAPGDTPAGARSRPVVGRLDARAALRQLIAGSGLEIASSAGGVIVLRHATGAPQTASEAVVVEDIVVTSSRRPQPVEQLGSALSVFSSQDIENQQLTTVDDVLQRIPGVTIIRYGGIGQDTHVRMRGLTTKHVLVMIDGVKLNNPAEIDNQFGLENLLLGEVERVEVLRGPQSGLYGGDASAGVIHVITRRPQGAPQSKISALYGDNNTQEIAASSMGRVSGLGYSVSASRHQTDGISLASRPPGNIERDGYENTTFSARLDWDATDVLQLEAWLRYTDSRADLDVGMLPPDNTLGLPGWIPQDSDGTTSSEQLFAVVKGRLETLGGRLTHVAQLSYVDMQSTLDTEEMLQEGQGRTTEAAYYATYDLGRGAFLLGGFEHKREEGRFSEPRGGGYGITVDETLTLNSAFLTFNLTPVEGAYLSGAVRYDDSSQFGDDTTWRLTAAYNLREGFDVPGVATKLRAAYGTGGEAPGMRQMLGSSPTYRGNPNLTPESSWMWDVGVDQRLRNGFARWSLTYYKGEATNGIFDAIDADTGLRTYANTDFPVELEGVEFEASLHPASWMDIDLTYADASTLLGGAQLFGRPRQEATLAVTVRPTHRLSVTADAYMRTHFYADYPTDYRMPGYELLNLSASYDLTNTLRVSARLQNVFDDFHEDNLGTSSYGRTAQVRLTATF